MQILLGCTDNLFRRFPQPPEGRIITGVKEVSKNEQQVLSHSCMLLYERHGSSEEGARKTTLDRRTVQKYIDQGYRAGCL
jgi:hypothetical protein